MPDLAAGPKQTIKAIAGGFLVQLADDEIDSLENWQIVTTKQPTKDQTAELTFAWKVLNTSNPTLL